MVLEIAEGKNMKIGQNDARIGINRDMIKMIAMVTMTLNHIAAVFLETGTPLYEILTDIGYFTAITMCYFLVEGYSYTRSRKKYAGRLLLFAMISQLPYNLAFSEHGITDFPNLNMMFTLFFCFWIIYAKKEVTQEKTRRNIIVISVLATVFCDWPVYAAVFTLLFLRAEDSQKQKQGAFIAAMISFGIINFFDKVGAYSFQNTVLMAFGAMTGIGLSGICLLSFYNGKKAAKGSAFLKWFFYLYYPAHLLVLGLIRYYK